MTSKSTPPSSIGSHNSNVFFQIFVVVVFLAALWFFDWSSGDSRDQRAQAQIATAVFHMERQSRVFSGEIIDGMTVIDALRASADAGNIRIDYRLSHEGDVFIDHIDSYSHDQHVFSVTVNGKPVSIKDTNRSVVRAGDVVDVYVQ